MSRLGMGVGVWLLASIATLCLLLATSATGADVRPQRFFPSLHDATHTRVHLHALEADDFSTLASRSFSASSSGHRLFRALSSLPSHSSSHRSRAGAEDLAQAAAQRVFIVRTQAPFTAAMRDDLAAYIAPHVLGAYLPHHCYLVHLGHTGDAADQESEESTVAEAFRLAAHASHPRAAALLASPSSRWNSSAVEAWLRLAPGVLGVTTRAPYHALHPQIATALERVHASNRRRVLRVGTLASEQAEAEQDWSFTDYDHGASSASNSRWRKLLTATATDDDDTPARPFHVVSLNVQLDAHPLLHHSPRDLVSSSSHVLGESTEEHEHHLAEERAALVHATTVLNFWRDQLQALDLTAAAIVPSDDGDAAWWRASAHAASAKFEVTVSVFDPKAKTNHEHEICDSLTRPTHVHLTLITPTQVSVHASSWFLSFLTRFLSTRSQVAWIEPGPRGLTTMNKYATALTQSPRDTTTNPTANATRIWDQGLRGQGQVIQLGDTGLDADNCFFSDPSRSLPINTVDKLHRKIVSYQLFGNADAGDDASGHGTHVGGSLAGSITSDPTNPLADFSGMAPDAKIAFSDFKRAGYNDLLVPPSVYKSYLGAAYTQVGARISSNSWGSPDGLYGSYCRELDQFSADYPDSLLVFAAGNYGETGGWRSVSSPGISKNVLTVGASRTSNEAYTDAGKDAGLGVEGLLSHVDGDGDSGGASTGHDGTMMRFSVSEANFGAKFASLDLKQVKAVLANPPDACKPLVNDPATLVDAVVLVRRGTCHFGPKVLMVQAAIPSVKLVLITNTVDGPPALMAADDGQAASLFTAAVAMVPRALGESLIAASLLVNTTMRLTAAVSVQVPGIDENVLASFSSRGPAFGGRLKPDVLAPGEFVRSVRSDGTLQSSGDALCPTDPDKGLLLLEGTSMATPLVAASASLARQYLLEGFYPSGVRSTTDVLAPSSALLKAMMIHSTSSTGGSVLTQNKNDARLFASDVTPAPSNFQGYGRVILEHVLRFAPDGDNSTNETEITSPLMSTSLPNLELLSTEPAMQSEDIHSFCYLVSPGPSSSAATLTTMPFFRATLVWTDTPAAAGASFILVNNLDLFVSLPSTSQVMLGNGFGFTDASGAHQLWDIENNVEQVSFDRPASFAEGSTEPLPVLVYVRATNVPSGVQKYGLVVSGWFNDSMSIPSDGSAAERIKHLPLSRCLEYDGVNLTDHLGILCPDNCGTSLGRGTCDYTTATCTCLGEWTGDDCSQPILPLAYTGKFKWSFPSISVPSDGWVYFSLSLPADSSKDLLAALDSGDVTALRLSMTRESARGDPDIFVSLSGDVPTLRAYDLANTQCDSCSATEAATDGETVAALGSPSIVEIATTKLKKTTLATSSTSSSTPTTLRVRIGVHGYCCDASTISLTVVGLRTSTSSTLGTVLGAVLGVFFALLLLFGLFLLWRRRRQRLALVRSQDVSLVPLPTTRVLPGAPPTFDLETSDVQALNGAPASPSALSTTTLSGASRSAPPPRSSSSTIRGASSSRARGGAAQQGRFMPLSKDEADFEPERVARRVQSPDVVDSRTHSTMEGEEHDDDALDL